MSNTYNGRSPSRRRGAATAEFAVIAPLFVLMSIGGAEMMRIVDSKMVMESAIRDGARLSTFARAKVLGPGESINERMEEDIRKFLTASGVDGDSVLLTITRADGGGKIDLDDPINAGVDFRIDLSMPYSAISRVVIPLGFHVHSHIVYRNASLY